MSFHVCISKPLPGLSVNTGRLCVDAAKEIAADNDGCTRTCRSSPSSGLTSPLRLFERDLFILFEENGRTSRTKPDEVTSETRPPVCRARLTLAESAGATEGFQMKI